MPVTHSPRTPPPRAPALGTEGAGGAASVVFASPVMFYSPKVRATYNPAGVPQRPVLRPPARQALDASDGRGGEDLTVAELVGGGEGRGAAGGHGWGGDSPMSEAGAKSYTSSVWQTLLGQFDLDGDGALSHSEFCAAVSEQRAPLVRCGLLRSDSDILDLWASIVGDAAGLADIKEVSSLLGLACCGLSSDASTISPSPTVSAVADGPLSRTPPPHPERHLENSHGGVASPGGSASSMGRFETLLAMQEEAAEASSSSEEEERAAPATSSLWSTSEGGGEERGRDLALSREAPQQSRSVRGSDSDPARSTAGGTGDSREHRDPAREEEEEEEEEAAGGSDHAPCAPASERTGRVGGERAPGARGRVEEAAGTEEEEDAEGRGGAREGARARAEDLRAALSASVSSEERAGDVRGGPASEWMGPPQDLRWTGPPGDLRAGRDRVNHGPTTQTLSSLEAFLI
ncbi:hypothetical protein T484DRAFT_1896618 [Baffinella frigidus]|nr:hypothetical protein T484DRAFT_1896618 [Cryptophyta sp. CCMP2293]